MRRRRVRGRVVSSIEDNDESRGVTCGCMKIEANWMNFELPLAFELALAFVCIPPVVEGAKNPAAFRNVS